MNLMKKYVDSYEQHQELCAERYAPLYKDESVFSRYERLEATQYPPMIQKFREKIYNVCLYMTDPEKYKKFRDAEHEQQLLEETLLTEPKNRKNNL